MGKTRLLSILAALGIIGISACGDDLGAIGDTDAGGNTNPDAGGTADASDSGPAATFSVAVTVTGLQGAGLVLQNNGADDLPITNDGTFAFSQKLAAGAAFNVSIKTQPSSPSQSCTVTGGTGTIASGNVTSVTVNCSTNKFTVGGTVTGLSGSGLVLQDNAGDDLTVNANGTFAFPTPIESGASYAVTVKTQPTAPPQTCVVTSGSGTVGSAPVTDVTIDCSTNKYTIGGTVTGLSGTGLVLQNNASDDLTVNADGTFTFATPIQSGASYAITIKTQPAGPTQTCTVSGDTGTVAAGNVTSVTVNCTTNKYVVSGSVTGIVGSGLVLQNNAGDDLPINADGSFAFATPVDSGAGYAVTVKTQPTSLSQTCTVSNGTGTVTNANVSDVAVACVTNSFTVGGTVSIPGGSIVLTNNGGDDRTIGSSGPFTFATPLLSGSTYTVAIKSKPAGLTCSVASGNGTVTNGNVSDVTITCTARASCLAIKQANPAATDGDYVIDPDGAGPKPGLTVHCDMTTDGGGYTYYKMTGGISTTKRTEANSCQALGLEIAVPRTAAHLQAMFAWTGSDMSYFQTVPGIYGTKNSVNYSNCPLNSNSTCASIKTDWAAIDGKSWFASSRTNITEPNGDYTPDCWLGNGGTIDANGYTWFNDGNCGYATGGNYVCSDNAKDGKVYGPSHTFVGLTGTHFITQGGCSPTGDRSTNDANYFCQHFYNDATCVAQSFSIGTTSSPTDVKLHNRNGCTGNGSDIPGTTCNGGPCKIGNWNESTSGINDLVCRCQ